MLVQLFDYVASETLDKAALIDYIDRMSSDLETTWVAVAQSYASLRIYCMSPDRYYISPAKKPIRIDPGKSSFKLGGAKRTLCCETQNDDQGKALSCLGQSEFSYSSGQSFDCPKPL